MPFGQASGPPASARQVQELLALLREAGHDDFRDARGPMGFNQRQAAGKFTGDEAAAFIEALEQADTDGATEDEEGGVLHLVSAERLAAELRRRGWEVSRP